jgi:hypothetical protein
MRTHHCRGEANTWCVHTWPAGPCITSASPFRSTSEHASVVSVVSCSTRMSRGRCVGAVFRTHVAAAGTAAVVHACLPRV